MTTSSLHNSGDGESTASTSVVGLAEVRTPWHGSPETGQFDLSPSTVSESPHAPHSLQQQQESAVRSSANRLTAAVTHVGKIVPSAQVQPTRGIDAINAVHNAIPRASVRQGIF